MNGPTIVAIAGTIAVVVPAWLVFWRGRGSDRRKAAKDAAEAETQAVSELFSQNIALNRYIDGRVAELMQPATERIKSLEEKLERLTAREATTKDIVRRFFQRLLFWDERGRKGPMPMPSPEDMAILDITDIQADTLTAAEVAALRTTQPKE